LPRDALSVHPFEPMHVLLLLRDALWTHVCHRALISWLPDPLEDALRGHQWLTELVHCALASLLELVPIVIDFEEARVAVVDRVGRE